MEHLRKSILINIVPKEEEIALISKTIKRKLINKDEKDEKRKKGRPSQLDKEKDFDPSSVNLV